MLKFLLLWLQTKFSTKTVVIIQKATMISFIVGAFIVFGRVLYLDSYYAYNGAKEPQPSEGRIYEKYFHHGSKVFLTKSEAFEFVILLPFLCVAQFTVAILLNKRWKPFTPEKKPKWHLKTFESKQAQKKEDI